MVKKIMTELPQYFLILHYIFRSILMKQFENLRCMLYIILQILLIFIYQGKKLKITKAI